MEGKTPSLIFRGLSRSISDITQAISSLISEVQYISE
jgi:hypothetical protein